MVGTYVDWVVWGAVEGPYTTRLEAAAVPLVLAAVGVTNALWDEYGCVLVSSTIWGLVLVSRVDNGAMTDPRCGRIGIFGAGALVLCCWEAGSWIDPLVDVAAAWGADFSEFFSQFARLVGVDVPMMYAIPGDNGFIAGE